MRLPAIVIAVLLGQAYTTAQGVEWNPRPTIRLGDVAQIDFRLKLQFDFRGFEPDQDTDTHTFEVHRRRAGIQGELFQRVAFEIERELRPSGPWRDVFVNVRAARWLEIKGGQFKVPFGLEELTGSTDLDYIYRTRASDAISPSRDVGMMAHGRIRRVIEYEVGLFRNDGDNGRVPEPVFLLPGEPEPAGVPTVAARVVALPIRLGRNDERPRVGVAVTSSTLPEGLNSLHGRTVFGSDFFPRVYVRGRRTRVGIEGAWDRGPFGFRAEYLRASDDREGQGLDSSDLSDMVARGWYTGATWVVTGQRKANGIRPRRPLSEPGLGAVEIATRFESLSFGSVSQDGPAFRNPRAEHIAVNEEHVWTTGVNWYANRWVKIQANAIREHITDETRTPVTGSRTFWSGVLRLQVVM
jgi:phosphate-selective porin OprO and OprP